KGTIGRWNGSPKKRRRCFEERQNNGMYWRLGASSNEHIGSTAHDRPIRLPKCVQTTTGIVDWYFTVALKAIMNGESSDICNVEPRKRRVGTHEMWAQLI